MDKQIMLHRFMETELNRYKGLYNEFGELLPFLPKGAIIKRGEGVYSAKRRDDGKQYQMALIPGDELLYKQLKQRRYIKEEMPVLKKKISLCENFLRYDPILDPFGIEKRLKEPYQGLTGVNVFLPGDINPEEWKNTVHSANPAYPERLIHMTEGGIKTRSKSEAMIGTQLERSGLPFKYEAELRLGQRKVFPDFTILHPVLRRLIYWEHLGKVADPGYMMANLNKLIEYAGNNIILGYNLILTFETLDQPLTIQTINNTINGIWELN